MFSRSFLFFLIFLSTTKIFALPDTLCRKEVRVALSTYHESCRDSGLKSTAYLRLQAYRDMIDAPGYYSECKLSSGYWSYYAELNLDLAYDPHVDTIAKLKYLETAIAANKNAVLLNNDTTSTNHELPLIMWKVFDLQSRIYYSLRDSLQYAKALHRLDSTSHWMQYKSPAKINSGQAALPYNKPGYESYIITLHLYNDSLNKFSTDSTHSPQIVATAISTGEKYAPTKYTDGKFVLQLPSGLFYSIEVTRSGYVSQTRKCNSRSGVKSDLHFNLTRQGVSFYDTPSGAIPFQRNDRLISMLKVDTCRKEIFDAWIKEIGLVQCSGDSILLFRKINGQPFDCAVDSVLLLVRSSPGKVEWAGPVLTTYLSSPLTVLNSVSIVFLPSHRLLPEEEKKMNEILARGNITLQWDNLYSAPESMGICLNDIVHELNQLPFVWHATLKTTGETPGF